MNIDFEQESTHSHAVLHHDLLVVGALALSLFGAMVILYFVNQSTGLLVNLVAGW